MRLTAITTSQPRYASTGTRARQAIALARAVGDRLTEGWSLGNLALIHDQQGRYQQAARCRR